MLPIIRAIEQTSPTIRAVHNNNKNNNGNKFALSK